MAASNVVSLSGGKDSTAMLLMLLERGESIEDIVFFDTGWEFPQMYEHLDRLEQFTGLHITRLHARLPVGVETEKSPFDWLFSEVPITKRGSGKTHMIGRGWPNVKIRWCTGHKRDALNTYQTALTHRQTAMLPLRQCIAFAADEQHRVDNLLERGSAYSTKRYPLVEWGITEKEALAYCYKRGFTWDGLYRFFNRVSCFCCPLQSLGDLRTLRKQFPNLWRKMFAMDSSLPDERDRPFKGTTLSALEARFAAEEAV